ncbi:lysine biosynthesis protein LysX [Candidatus Microgenomates bacterium]|nr:lysine biosynthesis protein LysX [Candidatus Microgenomates bacterium]MBI2622321.1 lysine biosynthesis protein LysX [Candidatus Microgenomates bacterium]
MKLGLLHTTIRGDEKLLIDGAKRRNVDLQVVDVREQIFDPLFYKTRFNVVLERCLSTVKGTHVIEFFENIGVPTVNTLRIARLCGDKFATSLVLARNKIPTPRFALVFGEEQAKLAVSELGGFPVVIKPVSGSWGRLVARINDMHALEAIIEQKTMLGGPHHQAIYIQKYVEKPGRDIRVHVIGGKVIAAIYRKSNHWITNTARGAEAVPCQIDADLKAISIKTGKATGEGVLGLDVFETKSGYVVNEVNHTIEFKNVQRVTGIDIAGAILDYCLKVAKK